MEALCRDLSNHTTEGYVYRVDLRLRPYGRSGPIVISKPALLKYYRESAALWEHQALLRLTPVAGDLEEGCAIAEELKSMMPCTWDRTEVVNSIDTLRSKTVLALKRSVLQGLDVKNGEGGLRDIEFLVQGLQLIHCCSHPGLLTGNTMDGLFRLGEHSILPASVVDHLTESYLYLRRVEHFIQIYDDRQTHMLPRDPRERKALHKRLEGDNSDSEDLLEKIERMMASVRKAYETYLINTV